MTPAWRLSSRRGEEFAFGAQGGLGGLALGDIDGHPGEELAAGALVVQGKFIGQPLARATVGHRDRFLQLDRAFPGEHLPVMRAEGGGRVRPEVRVRLAEPILPAHPEPVQQRLVAIKETARLVLDVGDGRGHAP